MNYFFSVFSSIFVIVSHQINMTPARVGDSK